MNKKVIISSFLKHYCLFKIKYLNVNLKVLYVGCFAQIILKLKLNKVQVAGLKFLLRLSTHVLNNMLLKDKIL